MSKEQRWTAFYIPSGKELPRTPPMGQVKKELLFSDEDESPLAGTPAAATTTTAGTPAATTAWTPAGDDLRECPPAEMIDVTDGGNRGAEWAVLKVRKWRLPLPRYPTVSTAPWVTWVC